jgi:uncharacterized delta-60 repeat protein
MPDLLPIKFKASGSSQSDGYSYAVFEKTTQFGGAIITPDLNIQYGPTSETNYYNNYEVPDNGYVMMNSDSNGHYIYAATGDTQFTQISNNIFKQNFSTIQNSLGYVYTATTFTVLNYNKPFIPYNYFSTQSIANGAHIEFGNTMSYPKTGINVYEIDGTSTGFPWVAINGPVFSATTPGFFTFDGTNDYFFKTTLFVEPNNRNVEQIWLRPRYSAAKSNYQILTNDLRLLQTITNTVFTIEKTSDGNILFGGAITKINGTNGYLFKSDSGFTLNTGFTPTILNDGEVIYKVIQSTTGKIYIGGRFSSINGVSVGPNLARLNSDGTLDSTFNVGTGFSGNGYTAEVKVILEDSSGNIYVGGNFNFYSGQSYNKLIKLNSSGGVDTSFDIGTGFRGGTNSGGVYFVNDLALSADGLRLYAGGDFTTYKSGLSATANATRLVRILTSNGDRDTSFPTATGVNGDVETILLDSSEKVYIGGQFTTVSGTAQNRIARLTYSGTLDTTFVVGTGLSTSGTAQKLKFNNTGKIIVGGLFSAYNGSTYQRLILLNTDGSIDTTLDTVSGFSGGVEDFVQLSNGSIIVGGLWATYKAVTRPQIIRITSGATYETSVTSLEGTTSLQFQPYSNLSSGFLPYYLFSGTSYDYFGGTQSVPNNDTFRNMVFEKWYLITKVSSNGNPPYDFYINGEKVFGYSGGTSVLMRYDSNTLGGGSGLGSNPNWLGDISEYIVKGLSALTDNDVLTYFNQTKSRYGY